jgi:hypothetical protein
VRDLAVWVSGGVPAPAAGAAHGVFPVGAYASSSAARVVRHALQAFTDQWYGGFAIVLTHYIEFRYEAGWEPEGHNLAPGTAAQFGWHWVNQNANTTMTRGGNQRQAVRIDIIDHGLIANAR